MSIISTAEFLVEFYEKLPEYLGAKSTDKASLKDFKKLKAFLKKVKGQLLKIKDDSSMHAAREQKKFVDATLALATEFLNAKKKLEVYPTPMEFMLNNSYHNKQYDELCKGAFKFFIH